MASIHSGVRPARLDDGALVVPLLVEAIDHLALRRPAPPTMPRPYCSSRAFEAGGNRYGREHVLALELSSEIAAVILVHPLRNEAALAAPVLVAYRTHVPPSRYSPEPELDALMVAPRYRGAGLASVLIAVACVSHCRRPCWRRAAGGNRQSDMQRVSMRNSISSSAAGAGWQATTTNA